MKKILTSAAIAAMAAFLKAADYPIAVTESVETNVVFDAQGICHHQIETNIVFSYTARNNQVLSFNLANFAKVWEGVHTIEGVRRNIHGEKKGTVITNGWKYIQYADGYVHGEKMIPRESKPKKSSKYTPFNAGKPRSLPLPRSINPKFNGRIAAIRARRRAAMSGEPKTVNATFGPGGRVIEAKDADAEAEVKQ